MQLRLLCALATAAALAPPAPRVASTPKRLKTRRVLADDVVLYAKGDELEGDAKVGSAGFRQLVGFRGAPETYELSEACTTDLGVAFELVAFGVEDNVVC